MGNQASHHIGETPAISTADARSMNDDTPVAMARTKRSELTTRSAFSIRKHSAELGPTSPASCQIHAGGPKAHMSNDPASISNGALEGLRIVELGQMVSAPYCGKLFSDFGAEVIKIEPPSVGDAARSWGPFPNDEAHIEKSGLYFFLNTNKRSVTLDIMTEHGREIFMALIEKADAVIENYLPQTLREKELDYAELKARNPNLVVISITPFGQTGPYAEWKGYDLNAFHMTATGSRYCGLPGQPPLEQGTFAADFYGAITGAAWGLGAIFGRDIVGHGQHVDVSSAEALAATFVGGQNIGAFAQDGAFESRSGVGMRLGAPATILPCKDGHVWMLALEPGQWNGLAKVMGNPEWMQIEMFQDMFNRAQNADAMYPLIEEWTLQHSKMEIMDLCQEAGCPITAVFTVAEAAEHEHIRARDYVRELEHAHLGKAKTLGAPFKLPDNPGGPVRPAPCLGEHTGEVLETLCGVSRADQETLKSQGII